MMIDLYPYDKKGKRKSDFFRIFRKMTGLSPIPFACGRSALVSGLRALRLTRTDEIFVPPFLGQCVLTALSKVTFPTMTPSFRTKAILVVHQFGFQQNLKAIERTAAQKGWRIVNDCCYTVFNRSGNKHLLQWGDFSVFSLAKLYPCLLGGGLLTDDQALRQRVLDDITNALRGDQQKVDEALRLLRKYRKDQYSDASVLGLDALFGYLPDLKSFPGEAQYALPMSDLEMQDDIRRRKNIWNIVHSAVPQHVPQVTAADIVPFAIPVQGDPNRLKQISQLLRTKLNVNVPVLHFDFAMNMLKPDYRKALVIGCHAQWDEKTVEKISEMIKGKLR